MAVEQILIFDLFLIEFLKITQAVAMGFAALGALGYFVKVSIRILGYGPVMRGLGENRAWC
jgi:hypothetical protein